ncbi:unnamed protein product [Triticum turgidum subsp. durum]|uniref:K+ potassium transporter integral membrane domain-containing protein n=1 Tax=Triticum turgidum subsp. durum TaxID=4567 RepID=A0A9R0ZJS5_TRITD|nr:unnamed protein product [Triticum turgidum subsp. durum]
MKSAPTMDPETAATPGTPPESTGRRGEGRKRLPWRMTLSLAYQSLGVVYGDLSTSPLYVYKAAFADDIQHSETNEEILGVLSFVFWTLTLVPLLKYVCVVLRADDNGEGGTFALYSLLCRHARAALLPPGRGAEPGDEDQFSDAGGAVAKKYLEYDNADALGGRGGGAAASVRRVLERHKVLQRVLLVLALVGTCMVIGDGVLTPAISVELSMEKGHHKIHFRPDRDRMASMHKHDWCLQYCEMGASCVSSVISVLHVQVLEENTERRLDVTGGNTALCYMFADLGHFNQLSIQIAFTCMVYPSLILAYMGQAAYLSKHHILEGDYRVGFYVSVP